MCLASIYDMSADELIAHLESLLRARRERQTTSPAAAPDLPPDCLPPPPGRAVAGEPSLNAPRRTNGAIT